MANRVNSFVNPRKRSIQLPGGAKDLIEVLQPRRRARCEYCNTPAVAMVFLDLRIERWCRACSRDLDEFAAAEDYKMDFDASDEAAKSRFLDELKRRQDKFMQERIKARHGGKRLCQ
jgi:hypothetical protein